MRVVVAIPANGELLVMVAQSTILATIRPCEITGEGLTLRSFWTSVNILIHPAN
jgi:hypothetical protein